MTFQDYQLGPVVNKGLISLGFETPTKIQSAAIPLILEGNDIIGCAETGSGKTGAFAIPLYSKILNHPQSRLLVLTPTRELGQQVADFFHKIIGKENSPEIATLVGGVDMRKQLNALKRKPRIIVGTPGRTTDHLKRGTLKLTHTEYLVLDEGDRMLDMGFAPQLDEILKYLPKKRQTCLFTATLAPRVKTLANKYLSSPKFIQVGEASKPVENIFQQVVEVSEKEKHELILDELNRRKGSIIVFLRTKRRTNKLYKYLKDYAYKVDHIHGDRSQGQRSSAIKRFRQGESRILCATDVAARGLDIPAVEHVINFDLPMMREDYLHRIGRTARNGAKGEAISFVTYSDKREWQALVREFKIKGANLGKGDERKPSHRGNISDQRIKKEQFKDKIHSDSFLEEVEKEFLDQQRSKKKRKKKTRKPLARTSRKAGTDPNKKASHKKPKRKKSNWPRANAKKKSSSQRGRPRP